MTFTLSISDIHTLTFTLSLSHTYIDFHPISLTHTLTEGLGSCQEARRGAKVGGQVGETMAALDSPTGPPVPIGCKLYRNPPVGILVSNSTLNSISMGRATWNGGVFLFDFLTSSLATRRQYLRLPSDNFTCCHTETEREDHDLCLNQSHYTDTDLTS